MNTTANSFSWQDRQAGVSANGSRLVVALDYLRRGWSIIPIGHGTKKPPGRFSWKTFQKAPPNEAQVRKWFRADADHGIAVILGPVSNGLVCRDFDALESYEAWAARYPDLARRLPTVATSRGRHVYFRAEGPNLTFFDLRKHDPPEDGEYRGDSGHYCVVPPSRHPDGHVYRWVIPLPGGEIPLLNDEEVATLQKSYPCSAEDTERAVDTGLHRTPRTTQAIVFLGGEKIVATRFDKNDADIDEAILATIPTRIGRRNRQVFELARVLKGIPRLADAQADDLKEAVRKWHQVSLSNKVIGTEPFEETWIDFLKGWPKVKFPKGQGPMTAIYEQAKIRSLPAVAGRYESEPLRFLIALCRELRDASSGGDFFLSCRTAGTLLGVDPSTAARHLFLLVHDGILVKTEDGDRARRLANRYRYQGDD